MGEKTLIKGSFLWDGICENLIPECRIIIENKIIKSIFGLNFIFADTKSQLSTNI